MILKPPLCKLDGQVKTLLMEKYLLQGHAAFWLGCLWIKSSNEEETREENSLANKNIIRQSFGEKKETSPL